MVQAQSKRRLGVKISVVIPAYNAASFLPRCLESVFAQTLKPEEVLVIDDGSTDNTAALAEALGARVIRRQNGGVSAARNTGIKIASGEWIALLDADDRWAPEKLERQAAFAGSDTVLVYTGVRTFYDTGVLGEGSTIDAISARKMLRYCNPITTSSVLVRRRALMQDGGFSEDILACEDWEVWYRLQRLGQFVVVPGALTDYYVLPNSLSANPGRMLQSLDQIMDRTLLVGLQGFDRWAWEHRIRAVQLCSAGLIARDNKLKDELRYMFRSLCSWPSPFWERERFAMFAVSARNRLYRREQVP